MVLWLTGFGVEHKRVENRPEKYSPVLGYSSNSSHQAAVNKWYISRSRVFIILLILNQFYSNCKLAILSQELSSELWITRHFLRFCSDFILVCLYYIEFRWSLVKCRLKEFLFSVSHKPDRLPHNCQSLCCVMLKRTTSITWNQSSET